MKVGKKLIIGFMIIASLVGFVGIFSVISHNNIQTNSKIITKVLELDILLDESLVELLALIHSENVEDYIREKSDYEQTRAKFDALFKQLNNEYTKKLQDLGFNTETFCKNADELAKISNRLIAHHKRSLAKNRASEEKESLEKELRHNILSALVALQDSALTRDVELMRYKSKEAIYQYKDQKHGVEWLDSISKVKDNSLIVPSQDISKDLNAYERVAQDLCKIIVEQKTIETQEHLVFGELKELINRLEENQAGIVNKIKTESQTLARNTHLTMFVVIAGAFLVSIILGLTIAHSISKPVANLAQTTQAIAQGDFSVRVDVATTDEIGELATSFNKMAEDLQRTTTSIDNLNDANQQLQAIQRELEVTVEKLTVANRELADFVYITAHDLKAPLRGIGTLAEWISTDYADKFDEEGKKQINLLIQRSQRMYEQITSILRYSEIGRNTYKREKIDLNKLVEEIISDIAPLENIQITIADKLPTPVCDKIHLTQIFYNLLSNAIKYADKPDVQVTIGCVEDDGFWKFSVADNGPGIEEKYFDKIFKIFQTLSAKDDHKGIGIGLAIVRKVVEVYGGKIWVESTPGQGTTFFFTLGKHKEPTGIETEKEHETNIIC